MVSHELITYFFLTAAAAAATPRLALGTLTVPFLIAGARVPPTDMPAIPDAGGIPDFFIFAGLF